MARKPKTEPVQNSPPRGELPPIADRHGPAEPVESPYGVARLRAAMNLEEADVEQLCNEAAREIEDAREKKWLRSTK